MKTILSILLFTLLSVYGFAQAPERFAQTYHFPPNIKSQSYGVANTSYGYMVAGISADSVGNPQGYFAYTVSGHDYFGNLLWYKRHQMSPENNMLAGWYNHDFIQEIDGFYYSTYGVRNLVTESIYSYLVKLNSQGDTIWTKRYNFVSLDSILQTRSVSPSFDGGFIICGLEGVQNGNDKTFILKTDSLGNIQWKKSHDLSSQREYVFKAIQDPVTKKIIVVGEKSFNSTSFVCFLDSLGNMLQQKKFNSSNGGHLYNIRQLNDGDFIAVGDEKTGNVQGGFDLTRPMVLRFNINGGLLWKSVSGYESIGNSFFSLLLESGDTIVAVGYSDTLYTQSLGFNGILCIQKMTSSGGFIWRRIIDVFNNNPSNGVFQSIVKSDDGGYATTGYDFMAASPDPFVLIKLDEWACLTEGCQTAGIDDVENDFIVNIFPNPANENLMVSLPENTLSTACILFDNLGKEIARYTIYGGDNNLNIKELQSGMYSIQVHSKMFKFIKN
jgi:hypothetical protein